MDNKKTEARVIMGEEAEVPFQGAATLINKFYITSTSSGVRIAFAEQGVVDGISYHRAAVAMSFQDAVSLKNVLDMVLRELETKLKSED